MEESSAIFIQCVPPMVALGINIQQTNGEREEVEVCEGISVGQIWE
jgi:hypothetical protein